MASAEFNREEFFRRVYAGNVTWEAGDMDWPLFAIAADGNPKSFEGVMVVNYPDVITLFMEELRTKMGSEERAVMSDLTDGYVWLELAPAPSFSGGVDIPSLATIYTTHYDRLVAVLDAARTGNRLLLGLAIAEADKWGCKDSDPNEIARQDARRAAKKGQAE